MFDNVHRFSSSDVVNSGFGYHSSIDRDSRQGSNDPAVSANSYVLRDGGGGWSSFEAHRTDSNVANADGPDGGGNGIIAYSEVSGVEGVSDGIFDSEYWDGGEADYISESDLPDINCPGEASRCVASIDVMTRQSGWGSEPSESFTIDID